MLGIKSRFYEHLDPEEPRTSSEADVRLEEILAEEHERVRSSSSSTSSSASSSSKESMDKERSEIFIKKMGWKKKIRLPHFGRL